MAKRLAWLLLLPIVMQGGCSNAGPRILTEDVKGQEILSEVGEIYRQFSFTSKKPPGKLADLAKFESAMPVGFNMVKTGEVIVRYGAELSSLEEGPPTGSSDEIVAYEKKVPESGGQVLMLNRETRHMTPEEFKVAKLAGTSSSSDEIKAKTKG